MYGDIIKTPIGVCKICGRIVYNYTKEGYRCFKVVYNCEHKNAGYIKKGDFKMDEKLLSDMRINEYMQRLTQAKENVILACMKYNKIGCDTGNEILKLEFINKQSFTSDVISLEGWNKKIDLIPADEILYDIYSYNRPKNENIYIKAICKYGEIHQLLKCIEEMAEFQREITRIITTIGYFDMYEIPDSFIDELVDVLITTEQVKKLVLKTPNGEFRLKNKLQQKMDRLEKIVNENQSLK